MGDGAISENVFNDAVRRQIAENAARTPTERFQALCALLDAARALAPMDAESHERRLRLRALREAQRKRFAGELSRIIAAGRDGADPSD